MVHATFLQNNFNRHIVAINNYTAIHQPQTSLPLLILFRFQEKEPKRKILTELSPTTFIGLRERGSEGVACPKGDAYSFGGYPKFVYRPIGRFVVSGRGVDDNSRLEVDDSSVCSGILLSPCRGALNNPSMCPVYDCFPPSSSCQKQKRLSPVGSSPLSPSAVRSLGAIKREEPRTSGRLRDSSISGEVSSRRYVVSCIASIDTEAKLGTKNRLCKFDFIDFSDFTSKNYLTHQ